MITKYFTITKQQIKYASLFGFLFGGLYIIINSINDTGNIEFIIKIARHGPATIVITLSLFLAGCCSFIVNNNIKIRKVI